jgi:DNA-binding cell septation regulator SpoVG
MIEVARLYRVDNDSSLKAFVDVIVNGQVLVKGIKVFRNRDGNEFVAMPKQQGKDGRWYEIVSLLDEEVKQEMQEAVLEAFNV